VLGSIKRWKIVALLLVFCLTCLLIRLFLMGRFLDVLMRLVEVLGKLGRK